MSVGLKNYIYIYIFFFSISFRYSDSTPWIYRNLEFGIDLDTRLALVLFFFALKAILIGF